MKVENSIRTLIRESKTFQIPNAIITTAALGNVLMERSLQELLQKRLITQATFDAANGSAAKQQLPQAAPASARPGVRPGATPGARPGATQGTVQRTQMTQVRQPGTTVPGGQPPRR